MSRDSSYYQLDHFDDAEGAPLVEIEKLPLTPRSDSVLFRYFSPIIVFALTIFAGIFLAASSSSSFSFQRHKFINASTDAGETFDVSFVASAQPSPGSLFTSSSGELVLFSDQDGYLYRSSDYGKTYTTSQALVYGEGQYGVLAGMVMTESGDRMIAGTGNMGTFHSTDFGVTWELLSAVPCSIIATTSDDLENLACIGGPRSQDNFLYYSTDIGHTFVKSSAEEHDWVGLVGSSTTGTMLAAMATGYNYTFKSTDSGQTWEQGEQPESMQWGCLAASNDMSRMILTDSITRNVHMSQDQGDHWYQAYDARHDVLQDDMLLNACTVSGDGVYFVLGFTDTAIKITTNCTSTGVGDCDDKWVNQEDATTTGRFNTTALAISHDGSYIYAADATTWEVAVGTVEG